MRISGGLSGVTRYFKKFQGIPEAFQGCSRKFQVYFRGVPGSPSGVTEVFQGTQWVSGSFDGILEVLGDPVVLQGAIAWSFRRF